MDRRRFIGGVGLGLISLSIAGCNIIPDSGETQETSTTPSTATSVDNENTTETQTGTTNSTDSSTPKNEEPTTNMQTGVNNNPNPSTPANNSTQTIKQGSLGLLSVNYTLYYVDKKASNQLAVWIEDQYGKYIRTLFVTSFTARGGYKLRPESLSDWMKASDWVNVSEEEFESACRPMQYPPGKTILYWDCTDRNGKPVGPGTYVYKIEGNIFWANRVMYTGKIQIGNNPDSSVASVRYIPEDAYKEGKLVENVSAAFSPGEPLDASKVTTYTRGS